MKYHSLSFYHLSQEFELPLFSKLLSLLIRHFGMNEMFSKILRYKVSVHGDNLVTDCRRDMPF